MRAVGIIDVNPAASPYRFEVTDNLAQTLPNPTGTITIQSAGTGIAQVTVRVTWVGVPARAMGGDHEATALIANND